MVKYQLLSLRLSHLLSCQLRLIVSQLILVRVVMDCASLEIWIQ